MNNEEIIQLRKTLLKIADLVNLAINIDNTGSVLSQQVCTPKLLPKDLLVSAARHAVAINPLNHPNMNQLKALMPSFQLTQEHIAILTSKRWHIDGVHLTVGFLDSPPKDLRDKILSHMNAWSQTANIEFVETLTDPQVRIAREPGDGYWSYVGTDILNIPPDKPTMNLDSFTMATPDSEFLRVVRHETGHTLGFPHEHMRSDLVNKIDKEKAFYYFALTQGWTQDEVIAQVLTPIEESSLLGTPFSDENSIMCYQIPGTITIDNKPILGGSDIDNWDYEYAAMFYPKK